MISLESFFFINRPSCNPSDGDVSALTQISVKTKRPPGRTLLSFKRCQALTSGPRFPGLSPAFAVKLVMVVALKTISTNIFSLVN